MKLEHMKYSTLQIALLEMLLEGGKGEEFTLDKISLSVYKRAGKVRPARARQSVAGLIRSTADKIDLIGAIIDRVSDIGRGNYAVYSLKGNRSNVQKTVDMNIERRSNNGK